MILQPCLHCPKREKCDTRKAVLDRVRGLGLTSARIRCRKWYEDFPPGQRVSLTLMSYDWGTGYDGSYSIKEKNVHEATVMRHRKNRILVWLDDMTSFGKNPIAVRADGLTVIEGRRRVCPQCGQPEGTKKRDEWYCDDEFHANEKDTTQ